MCAVMVTNGHGLAVSICGVRVDGDHDDDDTLPKLRFAAEQGKAGRPSKRSAHFLSFFLFCR